MQNMEIWFITGSQHLYGPEILEKVADDACRIAASLDSDPLFPAKLVWKPTVKTADEVSAICRAANNAENCVGIVAWMHTFSPAKMWIAGLQMLAKPLLHFHTQFNRDIPWDDIDMDFMNLNQSAHGGREFGFICSRLGIKREVVVGHWQDPQTRSEIVRWTRVAIGWQAMRSMKIARFGDNMRNVAVTEGNKVDAQIRFGFAVDGYGMGDLKAYVDRVTDQEVDDLLEEYRATYDFDDELLLQNVREQARIERGMRSFLEDGSYNAFTTTFEDLHGFAQLPGLAVQRLMVEGYGFGAEGDWKTAALIRAFKVIGQGNTGGTSFMEDYTYHFDPADPKVLGAHMLEICPSTADGRPRLETHPLSIGGKDDPARLVFDVGAGPAVNASLIDIGGRYRMIVNEVETVKPEHDLPNLPVARALWKPKPDLKTAATAWIMAGGAHHTAFTQQLDTHSIEIFCDMADIEMLLIDADTNMRDFKKELR